MSRVWSVDPDRKFSTARIGGLSFRLSLLDKNPAYLDVSKITSNILWDMLTPAMEHAKRALLQLASGEETTEGASAFMEGGNRTSGVSGCRMVEEMSGRPSHCVGAGAVSRSRVLGTADGKDSGNWSGSAVVSGRAAERECELV